MRLCVLGSSSSGNATYLELGDTKLLIDAGLSLRIIKQRLEQIGVDIDSLDGICITHEHTDHISGLKVLLRRHPIPVYTTRHTAVAVESILNINPEFYIFSPGEPFRIGDVQIEAFSVFHDAEDPVGFCFNYNDKKIALASDLGYVTTFVKRKLEQCHVLLIESNHDVSMLIADQKRPWPVKQRIKGRQGHLSNECACKLVEQIAHKNLEHVVLVHLSTDCNRPDMAYKRMTQTLREAGLHDTKLYLSYPHKPSQVIMFAGSIERSEPVAGVCGDQLEIPMVL